MRKQTIGSRRWLAPALLAVAVAGLTAVAADRVVVGEEFTKNG